MRRTAGPVTAALAALAALAVVAGCGGGSGAPSAGATTPPAYSPSPCPTPTKAVPPAHWPAAIPADIPKPKNAAIIGAPLTTQDGVHIVKFQTETGLRDGVLFIVEKFPKAGYVLGRGDAEATEADAPFIHGSTRGIVRISAVTPCRTLWLLATVKVTSNGTPGGSPLLPPHSPSGSPSPLPFG